MAETGWNKPVDQAAVSVGATATALITVPEVAGKPRKGVTITAIDGDIWYGGRNVAAGSQPLYQGQQRDIPSERGQIYAIRQGGANVAVNVTAWY